VQDRSNPQTTQLTSQQLKQLSKSSSQVVVTNKLHFLIKLAALNGFLLPKKRK